MKRCLKLKGLVLVLGMHFFAQGCATVSSSRTANEQVFSFPIVDAHIHTAFTDEPEKLSLIPYSKPRLIEELKQNQVQFAISMLARTGSGFDAELSSGFGGSKVVFCVGSTATPDYLEIERGLKQGRYGCIKIYLGYVHQYASHENYRKLYRLAARYDVPVIFHTGDTYSTQGKLKYSDPLTVDEVAVDFPETTFVIAHCGNPWIQSAAEVAYKNPNVYLDGSAFMIGDLSRLTDAELTESVVKPLKWVFQYVEDPTKLMFGTDWPLTEIGPYIKVFKQAVPEEHWKKVFYDNAVSVFRLNKSKPEFKK